MTSRTGRWNPVVLASLFLAAVGVADGDGTLLLAAAAPLAYVGYAAVSTVSVPEGIEATRSISSTTTPPGRSVEVSVTVHNKGERTITDCRVVDRVPESLAVVEGSPRLGSTLAPGESDSFDYTLVARRGEYDFGPPVCRVRDGSGTRVETVDLPVEGDDRLVCSLDAGAPPIGEAGREYVGRSGTGGPGRGIEFHSTREYRPGDPAKRIDWRHYAKRGSLAAIEYERRVSTAVVVAVDARPVNDAVPGPGRPSATERTAYAGTRALAAYLEAGHEVGVAVLGLEGEGPGGLCWLPPGRGPDRRARGTALLDRAVDEDGVSASHDRDGESAPHDRDGESAPLDRDGESAPLDDDGESVSFGVDGESAPSDGAGGSTILDEQIRTLIDLLPPSGQVVLLTPMLDEEPVEALRTMAAVGTPATLLSPAVLADNTVSGRFASVRRRTRLATCQGLGVRTIDWRRGTPLGAVLDRAVLDGTVHPAGGSVGSPPETGGGG